MSHVVRQDLTTACAAGIGPDTIAPGISQAKLDAGRRDAISLRARRDRSVPHDRPDF